MLKNIAILMTATAALGLLAAGPNASMPEPSALGGGTGGGSGGASTRVKLEVRMESGNDQSQARARYEMRQRNGLVIQRFDVSAEDFEPGTVLDVSVKGRFVGSITINNLGIGSLELRTGSRIDDPGDGSPIGDFPNLQAGDSVSVGPLSGTF